MPWKAKASSMPETTEREVKTYMVGDFRIRLARLRGSILCASAFLGGRRERASFLSEALR
jgi:hypothetical protein